MNRSVELRNDFGGSRLHFYDAKRAGTAFNDFIRPGGVIDRDSLLDFLLFGSILPPRTPLAGVRQLFPGEHILSDGSSSMRYQELPLSIRHDWNENDFVDALDSFLERYLQERPQVASVLLSGGIDSAIIASYLPKDATYLTWGGKGKDTDDVRYSRMTAEAFGNRNHQFVFADYDYDLEQYKKTVQRLGIPVLFNSAVPFIRLAEEAEKLGITNWHMGQNADTLFMSYPAPVYLKRLHRLNTRLPFLRLARGFHRKGYLLSTPSVVRLFAYFKSLGVYPGTGITVPDMYFREKEHFLDTLPARTLDQRIILTEEVLTESRRNQICQNEIPALRGITVSCPYYDEEFVTLMLSMPSRMRAKGGYQKVVMKKLAERRGVPHEVIYKNKSGLSYGFDTVMRSGRHLPIWDRMEADKELNALVGVRAVRARNENNYLTFIMLSSLHYWFELVARPRGLVMPL